VGLLSSYAKIYLVATYVSGFLLSITIISQEYFPRIFIGQKSATNGGQVCAGVPAIDGGCNQHLTEQRSCIGLHLLTAAQLDHLL
jgi:hypothetical protein